MKKYTIFHFIMLFVAFSVDHFWFMDINLPILLILNQFIATKLEI